MRDRKGETFEGVRPSFAPDVRASERIGVIDIGSNSVRLVVYDHASRSPANFFNEKILCGLGATLEDTGLLSDDGRARALATIQRFITLADLMKVGVLLTIATAAVRDAKNGAEFQREVEAATGLHMRVTTGEEEAQLAAKGVILGMPDADGVVSDLGGASMELIEVSKGEIGEGLSLNIGPLRLDRLGLEKQALNAHLDKTISKAAPKGWIGRDHLYVVGGAWRALAKLDMARKDYPLPVLQHYRIGLEDALDLAAWISETPLEKMREIADVSSSRLSVMPGAARAIERTLRVLRPKEIVVSANGLREGVLYENISPPMRAEDPLIEACRSFEADRARFPGFGDDLAAFLGPLFSDDDRLVRATCLVSDVAWRAHPDYRSRVCFETVTQASFGGVDHRDRVFMGAALLYRYKGGRRSALREPAVGLLSESDLHKAEQLGRAIRLGAMIGGAAPGVLDGCDLSLSDETLTLSLSKSLSELAGEVVSRRLSALAQSFGCEGEMKVGGKAG